MMRSCSRRPRGLYSAVIAVLLPEQIDRPDTPGTVPAPPFTQTATATKPVAQRTRRPAGLRFWNGFGGFTRDGRWSVIVIDGTSKRGPSLPPAPWTNVLANPQFGCLVTEGGLGYTWAGNSQMNRLTPWSNDPTSDSPGEVIYLRDEETGDFWTPTPLPLGPAAKMTVRHGQGYTRYTHDSRNLYQDLLVFVATDDPIKLVCLTVRNDGDRPRLLSATSYAEWVLGYVRENVSAPSRLRMRSGERRDIGAECVGGRLREEDRLRSLWFTDPVCHRRSYGVSRRTGLGFNGRRSEARGAIRPCGPGP